MYTNLWDNYWCINYPTMRVVTTIPWDMGTLYLSHLWHYSIHYTPRQCDTNSSPRAKPSPLPDSVEQWLRILFTFINGRKIKRIIISCDMWRLSDIQISVSTNKIPLEHSHSPCLHIVCGCFCAAKQSWRVAAVTRRPAKLKILTGGPFRESLPTLPQGSVEQVRTFVPAQDQGRCCFLSPSTCLISVRIVPCNQKDHP